MDRRDLLKSLGAGAALATGLAACSKKEAVGATAAAGPKLKWKLVTTWPANFPGLGTGATRLGELITAMSGGRLEVKVFGAGELVPALEVFDAVRTFTLPEYAAVGVSEAEAAAQYPVKVARFPFKSLGMGQCLGEVTGGAGEDNRPQRD